MELSAGPGADTAEPVYRFPELSKRAQLHFEPATVVHSSTRTESKKNGFKPNWNYRTVSSIHPDSAHLKIVSLHVSGRVSFAEKKSAVQSVFFPLTPANVEQK